MLFQYKMLLLKQLRYLNFNGVRKLNVVVQQITNPNQIRAISAQSLSRANKFETIRPKKFETSKITECKKSKNK